MQQAEVCPVNQETREWPQSAATEEKKKKPIKQHSSSRPPKLPASGWPGRITGCGEDD